jgi:hypothetical protein
MPAKLSKETVAQIKADLAEKALTQPEIAKKYKTTRSTVSDIACGRSHKDVTNKSVNETRRKTGGQFDINLVEEDADPLFLDMQAEIVSLRDERNQARRQMKIASKEKGLFQAVANEMERIVKPMKALPPGRKSYGKPKEAEYVEDVVMHLSDGHHDQIVVPEECGGLERHDFTTSICRAEHYVDTVLKWTQRTLAPQFHFPRLHVFAYGDHTSGEIHGHTSRSYFRNAFKNSMAIGQLHALMYRDLAAYFKDICVYYVPGNHGRRSQKKNFHGAHDNWDYLVAKTAQLYTADLLNVQFVIPNAFSINVDINGIGFNIFHGDDIKSSMGIPWYGLERQQYRLAALGGSTGNPVRYYCCGHFHRPGTTTLLNGEMMINGTWVATDAYAFNSFAGFTEPTQILHGVHPEKGVSWRLPVRLRDIRREKLGPQRYKIDLMDEVG